MGPGGLARHTGGASGPLSSGSDDRRARVSVGEPELRGASMMIRFRYCFWHRPPPFLVEPSGAK